MGRVRGGVVRTLLLSYLLVIVVGVATLVVTAQAVGPAFFAASMARMMRAHGAGRMMGPGTDTPMTPYLRAAFGDALTAALVAATGAATLAALLVGVLLSRRIVRPVRLCWPLGSSGPVRALAMLAMRSSIRWLVHVALITCTRLSLLGTRLPRAPCNRLSSPQVWSSARYPAQRPRQELLVGGTRAAEDPSQGAHTNHQAGEPASSPSGQPVRGVLPPPAGMMAALLRASGLLCTERCNDGEASILSVMALVCLPPVLG